MGVPCYFSKMIQKYPNIIKKNDIICHNLYMDCNSIIYDCIHKTNNKKELCKTICFTIEKYIIDVNVKNNVFITFDGVAPIAKLEQQRNRRFKSYYEKQLYTLYWKDKKSDDNDTSYRMIQNEWNHCMITPGTKFMKELNDEIKQYFNKSLKEKYQLHSLQINDSSQYGEGEHKIFEKIRKNSKYHQETNTFIYGIDSDLIMLSLSHSFLSKYHLYLYRETPHFIQSLNSELEPNELYVIDIPKMSESIISEIQNERMQLSNVNKGKIKEKNILHDYILLCFFIGNDFVSKTPCINIRSKGLDFIMNGYIKVISSKNKNLIKDGKIQWNQLFYLFRFLSQKEEERILRDYEYRNQPYQLKEHEQTIYGKFQAMPVLKRDTEIYIAPDEIGWRKRYYKSLFGINDDNEDEKIREICIHYLESLEWTFEYYTNGCPNWEWCYPYAYAPLLCDIVNVLKEMTNEDRLIKVLYGDKPKMKPLDLLCYVTPREYHKDILPKGVYNKLRVNKRYEEWYRNDWGIEWAFCRYFWESHVMMNPIDIKELQDIIHG